MSNVIVLQTRVYLNKLKRVARNALAGLMVLALLAACSSENANQEIDREREEMNRVNQKADHGQEDVGAAGREVLDEEHDTEPDFSELSDEELREIYGDSSVITAKVPRSKVLVRDVELSQTEREVLETLDEFNAVEAEAGTTLTLPDNILFDFDSYALRKEADDVIEQLVQVIESAEGAVKIVGHTDNVGDPAYNQTLSERRAEAVKEAFVDKGVAKERLEAVGKGDTEPVARNTRPDGSDDAEGRQKNRRVEVIVQGLQWDS